MNETLFTGDVIVQGITGTHGAFHTTRMLAAGTRVVAGVSPGKAGQAVAGVPVYSDVSSLRRDHPSVAISLIFVPPAHAKAAILEAIDASIPLIICITEGIPIHDMLVVKTRLKESSSRLIGPNCPGALLPGIAKLGIIPAEMGIAGSVGIVSRSGTLTYEVAAELTASGVGQKYIIGIGGDPVNGTSFVDCLELFENDPDVDTIVLIGEIGGQSEQAAARFITAQVSKPVYAYIAGHQAPPGTQMGHAGAILHGEHESAAAKTALLHSAGAHTARSITELSRLVSSSREVVY